MMKSSVKYLVPLGFCVAFLLWIPSRCTYTGPLQGVDPHKTVLVTQPGYFGSPIKWVLSAIESVPCKYELHGWQGKMLYYTETCFDVIQQIEFDAATNLSRVVDKVPSNLHLHEVSRAHILLSTVAAGVSPAHMEPSVRSLYVKDNGLAASDETMTAFITQRLYSVHDVMILVDSAE